MNEGPKVGPPFFAAPIVQRQYQQLERMKHVWILNHYAQEPKSGGGTRHFDLARRLSQHGWTASIIASGVEHNTGRDRLLGKSARLDVIDGVSFLWLATPSYRGNGAARLRNMLAYATRAILPSAISDLPKPDAIIGSSVHPFAGVSGYILARRYRVPFIFEVRDLWPETLIDMGAISEHGLAARFFRALEGFLYRKAVKIITPLPRAYDYISRFKIDEEKIVWIPNGVDFHRFSHVEPAPTREMFTLMYFGAHGVANGLSNVIDAMKSLAAYPIKLRLIGDGPEKTDLMKRAEGMTSISFEPPIPKEAIPTVAAEADAFVFNLINAPVFRFGISPNKLSDFMAAARPVIFACDAVNNPVQDSSAGISVVPQAPEALADAILTMSQTSLADRNGMGQRGRQYVAENHSFDKLAEKFAATLDHALSR